MRLFRISVLPIALCFWLSGSTAARAEQFDIITRTDTGPGVVQFRIDKPNPTQRSTDYPSITFMPGDVVAIDAGGCVQSGGTGDTWHRYVNPSGGDSDRLYKGLITIPFATGVLEPIAKYAGKSVAVAPGAPPGSHLQLGFTDDNYSDNGYYSHDDGPNDQCKGSTGGPAWVTLTITHNGATPSPSGGGDPWDLVYTQFDENGIPLNPNWRANANGATPDPASCTWPWNGTNPPVCTTQIADKDTHWSCTLFSENYGFGGHANWMAGTYTGSVNWDQKSRPFTDDDDYSVNLSTDGGAGITAGSSYGVHTEFDSDETIDTLTDDFKLPWWQLFRSAVDAGDTQAHALIDGHRTIVSGLVGVDFAHTPGAESHPAWDMAIHANSDTSDDTWAVFSRNWGNEGYCSGDQHYIDYVQNQYTFTLPWPAGATSGTLKSNSVFYADGDTTPSVSVAFVPQREVRLTIANFADTSKHQLVGGEIHIAWATAAGRRLPQSRRMPPVRVSTARDRAELFMEASVAKLSPAQRAVFNDALPRVTRVVHARHRVQPRSIVLRMPLRPPAIRLRAAAHPRIRSVPDPQAVARKDAIIAALRKAYGGRIPGMREP